MRIEWWQEQPKRLFAAASEAREGTHHRRERLKTADR